MILIICIHLNKQQFNFLLGNGVGGGKESIISDNMKLLKGCLSITSKINYRFNITFVVLIIM